MRKIIALLLGVVMTLSLSTHVFASDDTSTPVPEGLETYALTFIDSVDAGHRSILDVTPMYDYTQTTVTGYYVTFQQDGKPAGYMVLALFGIENPIMEFATEGNGIVPTTYAAQSLVFMGPGQMYVAQKDGTFYNTLFQTETSYETVEALATDTALPADNGYFNGKFLDQATVTFSSKKTITAFGNPTQYPTQTEYGKDGNCGPTTAANILLYWTLNRNKQSVKQLIPTTATTTFSKGKALHDLCYDAMGTTASNGTQVANTIAGYTALLGQPNITNGNWKYYTVEGGRPTTTTWARYKQILDQNVPIQLFLAQTQIIGDITGGDKHFSFCYGYGTASDGTLYLQALTGSHKTHTCIQFLNYVPYLQAYGIEILK